MGHLKLKLNSHHLQIPEFLTFSVAVADGFENISISLQNLPTVILRIIPKIRQNTKRASRDLSGNIKDARTSEYSTGVTVTVLFLLTPLVNVYTG